MILAQSKLLVAARDVAPPEERRPSSALGVLGFPPDSSFTASPGATASAAPVDPAAGTKISSCYQVEHMHSLQQASSPCAQHCSCITTEIHRQCTRACMLTSAPFWQACITPVA